jgi:hypothetical protein
MHNGVNIRDLNGVEASTSQFPLIGYTVFWRLRFDAATVTKIKISPGTPI